MGTTIQLLQGEPARTLLADAGFCRQWQALYERCEWSTPFQSPSFCRAWFEVYRAYAPIVVCERSGDQDLAGLLVLATTPAGGLAVAGTHHAEYKGWLETAGQSHDFIARALDEVQSCLGAHSLDFSFLRHEQQAEILGSACRRAEVQPTPRQYKALNADSIRESLKKSGNKSKFSRLAKLGEVVFLRVNNAADFRRYLEVCSVYHDLWQGAMHATCPFHSDPGKLEFHVRLFETSPELLHVTVMLVDAAPVAMHIGYSHRREVCYSIVAHHPALHRYSLGKLQMLKVVEQLQQEGYQEIDLSPGWDEWKRNFASGQDQSYTAFIHRKPLQKHISVSRRRLKALLKSCALKLGLDPRKALARLRAWRRAGGRIRPAGAAVLRSRPDETAIYHLSRDAYTPGPAGGAGFSRDQLGDLLLYQEAQGGPSRQQFLAEAVRRLGDGEHVYTRTESGRLSCYGWLAERHAAANPDEAQPPSPYPGEGVVIHDIQVAVEAAGSDLYPALARRLLQDAFSTAGTAAVYAACPAGDAVAGSLFKDELGFQQLGTGRLQ